jgi:hypothetical protein
MRLVIETRRGVGDSMQEVTEVRQETELGWDATGEDYIRAIASFMFAMTFHPDTILEAMRQYIEEHDEDEWENDFADEDEWEESTEAEVGEKTAPVQNGEGGY